jgi:hypothetical protein
MMMGNINDKVILKFRVIRIVVIKLVVLCPLSIGVRILSVIDKLVLLIGMLGRLGRG